MAPNRYTELFFMDEATAYAAGHRPCFECRRQDYKIFKTFWLKGNPEYGFDEKTSIQKIDDILHKERYNRDGSKVTYKENIADLPNGTFVLYDDVPHVLLDNQVYPWSPFGYGGTADVPADKEITVLTPRSIVNSFKAGLVPQVGLP